jgi:phosphoribosyl 1,2-cyclic phosphate phosphodiesterase
VALRLTILGSGTSHGVPMIACDCPVCTSADPRDRRTRTSAVFSFDGHHVLVDTAPELRLQCLACHITQIDAILYTHAHADHVAGLDDVRRFNHLLGRALSVYASPDTLGRVRQMFGYAFTEDAEYPSAKPQLEAVEIHGPFELFGRRVTPIPYEHGPTEVFGYRVGNIAYCPDCSRIPESSRALLSGLDVLVLDALRHRSHPTHFNLAQALAEAGRSGAARTYFTHLTHDYDHDAAQAELPPGVELAYDGLRVECET